MSIKGYEINNTYYYLPRSLHYQKEVLMPNWRAVLAWSNSDLNYSTLVHSLPERFKTKDRIEKANHIAEMSILGKDMSKQKFQIIDFSLVVLVILVYIYFSMKN